MQVDEIIAKAQEATGLTDLGDPSVLEGLEVLIKASNEEARLSDVGAQRWQATIVGTLSNRLRIVDYLKRHPELLERPVEKPLFVFGLPRTGTTLTINLLSADPARRCLLRWEALNSAPPAQAGELHTDPRFIAEQERLAFAIKHAPQIAAIHYEDADSPTECQYAMALSFSAQIFDANVRIPSYRDWFLKTSYLPAFRFHKQLLQLLQANNGGRWTLKNPWHPLFLDDLTTVYPDAQLVMTHRDPVEVVGSACSLIRHVRPMFSDDVDLREIAEQMIETFDHMITRQNAFRDKHGEDSIFDIQYADQLRDPVGVMRRLYAHFDEELTPEAEAAMTSLLANNPQGKHGKHTYSLAEFGLTDAGVREHFKDYCDRYRIPVRAAAT
ncbi:sulfotransferase [Phenylobacterium sp. LjRoot225]|uniref:sulfotransferase family protein n=1 Tax=Phenylobacterium sp. LjRoot225 TaxID=3342285 RepID=UPI003ECE4B58